jgi:hypothetical protein
VEHRVPMAALGHKRTYKPFTSMSALSPKGNIRSAEWNVS